MSKLVCASCNNILNEVKKVYEAVFCSYCEMNDDFTELIEREAQIEDYFNCKYKCGHCDAIIKDKEIIEILDNMD